jgi:hypothetical protein
MTLDGDNKPLAIFDRVLAAITVVFAVLGYFLPPDPAHPRRFDFLSHTVSVPFWLALSTVFGLITITSFTVRWWLGRKTSHGLVVAMSEHLPTNQAPTIHTIEPQITPAHIDPTPKIPPIITVAIQKVAFDMDLPGLVIVLTNRGGSGALHIQIHDVHLERHTVQFDGSIDSLKPGGPSISFVPRVIEFTENNSHEIGMAMYDGITAQTWGPNERYDYEAAASFYDVSGKKFQTTWIYTFFPHRYKKFTETAPEDRGGLEPYLTVSSASTHPSVIYRGNWR